MNTPIITVGPTPGVVDIGQHAQDVTIGLGAATFTVLVSSVPATALALDGDPVVLDGEFLTL